MNINDLNGFKHARLYAVAILCVDYEKVLIAHIVVNRLFLSVAIY